MIVNKKHRRALYTVFVFMGGTLGAMVACEKLDDYIEEKYER